MKRFLSIALVLTLLLAFAACKQPEINANATPQPTSAVKVTPEPTGTSTDAPTQAPTEEPTELPDQTPDMEPVQTTPMPEIVEPDLSGLPKVIAGVDNYYISYPDGTLYAWGLNANGELGNGSKRKVTAPTLIAEGLVPVITGETVFAVSMDNTLWGWGRNDRAQLGLGDADEHLRPEELLHFITDVFCYEGCYYAMTGNGELYKWGIGYVNTDGMSDEELNALMTPQLIMEGVKKVYHEAFPMGIVKRNGELYRLGWNDELNKVADGVAECWGSLFATTDGKLMVIRDNGDTELVVESFRSVIYDREVFFIILEDGKLYSYITTDFGSEEPGEAYVLNYVMDGVTKVWAGHEMDEDWGYFYRFALKANGELWSWGHFNNSALGRGMMEDPNEPALVATDVRDLVTNGAAAYVIRTDGEVWATGMGGEDGIVLGGLGDGSLSTRYGFVRLNVYNTAYITDGFYQRFIEYDDGTDSVRLVYRTFAVQWDGTILAWGYNGDGLLGVDPADENVLSAAQVYVARE